jgi:RimJ/RimL family protein N-acetyltransferase
MSFIETERLLIRPWAAEDVSQVGAVYQDDRVTEFIGGNLSDADLEAFVHRQIAREAEGERVLRPVVEKATSRIVGACGLQRLEGGPIIEIGWKLSAACWGQGYASEAARAVLQRGHEEALARIVAMIFPRNRRSIAVANRLGLRFVKIVRAYQQDMLCYESVQ